MGIKIKNKGRISEAKKERRVRRVRARIFGTPERPRLAVERSLRHMRAQIIDDTAGRTLLAASDSEARGKAKGKVEAAAAVGKLLAEKAVKAGIKTVVFDRRSFRYHGRVKALADAAREGGLVF
jgi:large subunit ribosomal protein L18